MQFEDLFLAAVFTPMAMAKMPTAIAVELRFLINVRTDKRISCGTRVIPLAKIFERHASEFRLSADAVEHYLSNRYIKLQRSFVCSENVSVLGYCHAVSLL